MCIAGGFRIDSRSGLDELVDVVNEEWRYNFISIRASYNAQV